MTADTEDEELHRQAHWVPVSAPNFLSRNSLNKSRCPNEVRPPGSSLHDLVLSQAELCSPSHKSQTVKGDDEAEDWYVTMLKELDNKIFLTIAKKEV